MKLTEKIMYWLPRVICILAILFVSMFAADAFGPGMTFWEQLGGFIIHLIPSFILIGFLVVAWIWELTGGILLTLVGIGFSLFIYFLNFQRTNSVSTSLKIVIMIGIPFVIVGILFIVSHYMKKRNQSVKQ